MEKFNELVVTSVENLSSTEKEFLNIHNSIIYYGSNACLNMFEMAKRLELMKNSKAYLHAGFESFESYSEDCLGLKRSQVYNYIKIANSFSNDFLINNSKLGVTKLLVLSKLEEPVVEKVIETVEVENKSVNDLEKLVDKLKKDIKQLKEDNKTLVKANESYLKYLFHFAYSLIHFLIIELQSIVYYQL